MYAWREQTTYQDNTNVGKEMHVHGPIGEYDGGYNCGQPTTIATKLDH